MTGIANRRVVESPDDTVLHRIAEHDVALTIWHRRQAAKLAAWLDSLPPERLPKGHFIGPVACVPCRLASLCNLVALADSPERRALIDDIAGLARCFAARTDSPDVDLRLEVIAHDACWRFHRDHVGYRLNATYRGPGTQWPPLEHAARALKAQRRYRGPLNEFPRFAAGLFKGVVRAGTEAIVHRSPPVGASGQTRLFLCLNEVHDDE
ncbi:DUF1826 domain-containing protein [Reyranella sp.]|uniref:DUF1826 domain-containing protein n=1 Tax=Reyranella sp. TaxID=1929291 RepID=UPI002600371F|nr:DUF1826 domain-containing protein [Reyranella sp.]